MLRNHKIRISKKLEKPINFRDLVNIFEVKTSFAIRIFYFITRPSIMNSEGKRKFSKICDNTRALRGYLYSIFLEKKSTFEIVRTYVKLFFIKLLVFQIKV